MKKKTFVHLNPIWRDRANFIIGAWVDKEGAPGERTWEQLWARQIDGNHFQICCIPFFVYELALGDEVETAPDAEHQYMVQQVTKPSGHYTFRVWFDKTPEAVVDEMLKELASLGCPMEFYSERLLGVDAATSEQAQKAADALWRRELLGQIVYETGRTH